MRTKTLVLTAVLGVAAATTSMADVFSVNAVGYVNTPLHEGFNLICNPLNATNNSLNNIMGNAPIGAIVHRLVNGVFVDISEKETTTAWSIDYTFAPGEGFFFELPSGSPPYTNTFVGDVLTGTQTNSIPSGYSLRGSQVPQSLGLDGVGGMDFPSVPGDFVFILKPDASGYFSAENEIPGGWNGDFTVPVPNVGEGFFVLKAAPADWIRTFNINP